MSPGSLLLFLTMYDLLPNKSHCYDNEQNEQNKYNSSGRTMTITCTSTYSNTHLCHPPSSGMLFRRSE